MKLINKEILLEIRNILARIHDTHVGNTYDLSLIELAAMRDCLNRINLIIKDEFSDDKR